MKEFLLILGATILYTVILIFIFKWMKIFRIKNIKKVTEEMVKSGELTRSEADAIIWVINYSSRKKK